VIQLKGVTTYQQMERVYRCQRSNRQEAVVILVSAQMVKSITPIKEVSMKETELRDAVLISPWVMVLHPLMT